ARAVRSIGGWRARLVAVLGTAAIAAATLVPSGAKGPAPAWPAPAGTGAAAESSAFAVDPTSPVPAGTALPPTATSPSFAVAAQAAGIAVPAAPALMGPLHDAPPPRTTPQTPILDAPPPPRGVAPGATRAAADFLDVSTDTTYVVDPVARVVRVAVDITAVNRLPVTPGPALYYPGVNLAVQPEARQIVADEGGAHDRTTSQAKTGFRLLTVQFATPLYVGHTAHLHVAYLLPAGAPRSTSQVRVGAAYTTFVAWAFGDRGTVEVDVPARFDVATSGGAMEQAAGAGAQQVLAATVNDPVNWYAWIDARDDAALTSRALKLPDGEQVVVRAWPEDPTWEKDVANTLTSAIPSLVKRIGLPWPVTGQLSVIEVSAAMLEGYAGFYSPSDHQITISETVDPLTVVHEASHAWFNSSLFTDRWLTEGLADEYAYRTLKGLGVAVDGPAKVRANASVAFPLDTWGTPAPIKTRTQDAREQWGYDAAWTVVRQAVTKLGETKMAAVFAAASAGTTAYPAGGTPERSALRADWRRFVDLAEEVGGGRGIAELIGPWVLTTAERALLAPRAAARSAYHDLVAQGGDWAAPAVVRMDLDAWDFTGATSAIADATAVLALRDAIRGEAAAEHLAVPAALRTAYQTASSPEALKNAVEDEQALHRSLDAVVAADDALHAPRDWLVTLGLVGQDPSGELAAARVAWTSGDASRAAAGAASAHAALLVAADAGRLRLVAIGAGIVALALLVVLALTIVRRRSASRRRASAAAGASFTSRGPALAVGASGDGSTQGGVPVAGRPAGAPLGDAGWLAPGIAQGLGDAPPGGDDWIDPSLAPPPPPPWWTPPVPSASAAVPGPYPILPASAAAGPTPQPPAERQDEGAQ
ncbi:MAG: hypothetical protein ACYDAN_10995, partial [Candidatus Limnocylindrales bacterium]